MNKLSEWLLRSQYMSVKARAKLPLWQGYFLNLFETLDITRSHLISFVVHLGLIFIGIIFILCPPILIYDAWVNRKDARKEVEKWSKNES